MNYLTVLIIGIIVGLMVNVFLSLYSSYSPKRKVITPKEKGWATKDDVFKITNELENLKSYIYKTNYNETREIEIPETDDVSDAEKEFYESVAGEN